MKCLKCGKEVEHHDAYVAHDEHTVWYKCECGYDWYHDTYQKDEVYYWSERKKEYIKYRGKKTWKR